MKYVLTVFLNNKLIVFEFNLVFKVIISGFRDRGVWPFNKELILKLAEKEWLGKTPVKFNEDSIVVLEAQTVLSKMIGQKQQTPRASMKKVSDMLFFSYL